MVPSGTARIRISLASFLLCATTLPAMASPPPGQGAFIPLRGHDLTQVGFYASAIESVDVDLDGDLDLVVGHGGTLGFEQPGLYRNDGTGRFTLVSDGMPPLRGLTTGIAAGDLDQDGYPDLVIVNFGYGYGNVRNWLLRNEGGQRFVDVTSTHFPQYHSVCGTFQTSDASTGVVLADVNRDGHLDIVISNWCQNRLYINDGRGVFTDATFARMPTDSDTTNCVVAVDVDADGDVDLIFGNMRAVLSGTPMDRLYLNDGNGHFSDASSQLPRVDCETMVIRAADVNGDSHIDLVIGAGGYGLGGGGHQNRLFLNNGRRHFIDVTATHLPAQADNTHALCLFDADGDGDLDLHVGNGRHGNLEADRLLWNDGSGRFLDAMPHGVGGGVLSETLAVTAADLDSDGDVDLVVGRPGNLHLLLNQRTHVSVDVAPAVGTSVEVKFRIHPGALQRTQVVRVFLGLALHSTDLGSIGVAQIGPQRFLELAPVFVEAPIGIGHLHLAVPSDPSLRGLKFHIQGLILPDFVRFTNVWTETVV